ncbi:hypothetical protein V1J52_07550 [Streptomyces sp. TRM 70351]|uniref:hypothetical protein n=1 Tax=Streptomyces sp. TRM 70351 TaxID=3116552 RepID=UPI002E7BD42A|nr:hypothetical protein [Streptomyces sp. TRM 70351]MEE1928051.1 hypothetical protein [Streptomyces sp. TRM 70351]
MSFGQGGPGWGPGGSPSPDWNALADAAAASRARRRRWLLIIGGALSAVGVAAVVAVLVASQGGSPSADPTSLPSPEELPSGPSRAEPDFTEAPPPPNPHEFISDPAKDTAPRSAGTLFPLDSVTTDGGTLTRTATASTTDCASAATEALGAVLTAGGCTELHRATFTRDGIAVTVGVAVLGSPTAAAGAKDAAEPHVTPLTGGGTPDFCTYSACRASANALGRYAYFTVSGYLDGTDVTPEETTARAAGRDVAAHAADRLRARAEEQAAAAATATP